MKVEIVWKEINCKGEEVRVRSSRLKNEGGTTHANPIGPSQANDKATSKRQLQMSDLQTTRRP